MVLPPDLDVTLFHIISHKFHMGNDFSRSGNKKPSPAMMTSEGFFFNTYIINER